eukprot:2027033-Alexandrium_andersonii.AAC.1
MALLELLAALGALVAAKVLVDIKTLVAIGVLVAIGGLGAIGVLGGLAIGEAEVAGLLRRGRLEALLSPAGGAEGALVKLLALDATWGVTVRLGLLEVLGARVGDARG